MAFSPLSDVCSATKLTLLAMPMPVPTMMENCEHMMAMTFGLILPEPSSIVRKFGRSFTCATLLTTRHDAFAFSSASNSSNASTTPETRCPDADIPSYLKTATVLPS